MHIDENPVTESIIEGAYRFHKTVYKFLFRRIMEINIILKYEQV